MPGLNNFDPSGDPFAPLGSETTTPGSGFSLSVIVSYTPDDATAALTITENGSVYPATGAYPATAALNPDGTYTLTAALSSVPDGLSPGQVLVQPGSLTGGTFAADGPAIPGFLLAAPTPADLDWDAAVDGPYVQIGQPEAVVDADGVQWVHLRWAVTDAATGEMVQLTANPSVLALEMAIVHGLPTAPDWLPASLTTRAAGDSADGEYSQLKVGPGAALSLGSGTWRVYGRLITTGETIAVRSPGYLTVRSGADPSVILLAEPVATPLNTVILTAGAVLARPTLSPFFWFCDTGTGGFSLALFPATGGFGTFTFVNTSQNSLVLLAAGSDLLNGSPTLTIPAYSRAALTDYLPTKWSIDMSFNNSAPTGTEPIVAITATTTLAMPAVNTVYAVAITANATVSLPAATGSGRKLTFDLKSLSTFLLTLALNGSDAYEGGATLPPLVSGSSYTLRDLAAGVWAIE